MDWRGIWFGLQDWWNDLYVLIEVFMGLLLLELVLTVVRAWLRVLGY